MKNIQTRIEKIEDKLAQKTNAQDLDMKIEFYTCELGPECPMEKHKINELQAPEGLLIIDGKCQHKRFIDEIPVELREKYGIRY